MIDLSRKNRKFEKNDGFSGVPFGAVCGMILIAWFIWCLSASFLGWL